MTRRCLLKKQVFERRSEVTSGIFKVLFLFFSLFRSKMNFSSNIYECSLKIYQIDLAVAAFSVNEWGELLWCGNRKKVKLFLRIAISVYKYELF